MAEKTCPGTRSVPLSCPVGWLCRRRELEDMPMTRVRGSQESPCPCAGCGRCGELSATLELQTQLLYDVLAAVNGLAAAQLTHHD